METITTSGQDRECKVAGVAQKRKTCGLILTYDCNLDCRYCYIANKGKRSMSLAVAQEAIRRAFATATDFQEVEIDFVGAEPLKEFQRLKEISEWIWSQRWPKPYICFATTNGTLLTNEMKHWFREHREKFVLGVSYDGTQEMQDLNRSGSAPRVDLAFFQQTWPQQPVKMTISDQSLDHLYDGIVFLHQQNFLIRANLAHGVTWSDKSLQLYAEQLARLVHFYSQHPDLPRASLLDLDLQVLLQPPARFENKYCGAGQAFQVTDLDGQEYPCHMFSPLVLPAARLQTLSVMDFQTVETFQDPKCARCFLRHICPTCYGMNYRRSGNPAVREAAMCRMFIIQLLANCRLRATLLRAKPNPDQVDRRVASAITKVHELTRTHFATN